MSTLSKPKQFKRYNSVFGAYCTGIEHLPEEERVRVLQKLAEYNTLWKEYFQPINHFGGGIPTSKGFEHWLSERGYTEQKIKEIMT